MPVTSMAFFSSVSVSIWLMIELKISLLQKYETICAPKQVCSEKESWFVLSNFDIIEIYLLPELQSQQFLKTKYYLYFNWQIILQNSI